MRVLFASHSFPRHEGDSAGSFLIRLAHALASEGIEVVALAPSAPGLAPRETIAGIDVHRFRYAPEQYETLAYHGGMAEDVARSWTAKGAMSAMIVAEIAALRKLTSVVRPSIVHAHWWFPSGLAASLAPLGDARLVTTCHGSDIRLLAKKSAAAPLARRVFRKSAETTVVSSWLARMAEQMTGLLPSVAPMPVDTLLFETSPHAPNGKILFVGRLTAQKGVHHAISALAMMQQPATLDIVGDGPERGALVKLAESLGVASRVRWTSAVSQKDLARLMATADVFVMPSIDEGLGLVAVESQLCGTPVVAFDSGGIPDVVRSGENGVLVPPGDTASLAAALDELIMDPTLRSRLGGAGRASALATFAPSVVATKYAAIYRRATEKDAA